MFPSYRNRSVDLQSKKSKSCGPLLKNRPSDMFERVVISLRNPLEQRLQNRELEESQ